MRTLLHKIFYISGSIIISFCFAGIALAASNDSITVVDVTNESNNAPTQHQSVLPDNSNHKSDDERLSACEENVQNLTGRIELLERAVKELRQSSGITSATNTDSTLVSNSANSSTKTDGSGATDSITSSPNNADEKREYDLALAALKESRFADAEKLFAEFMQKYTHSDLIGNAYFWYAETFYRRGEFEKAAVDYLKGYRKFPKSPKAPDNLLKLALSLGELKKFKDACAMLGKLEAEYKNRPASSIKRANDAKAKYCK